MLHLAKNGATALGRIKNLALIILLLLSRVIALEKPFVIDKRLH